MDAETYRGWNVGRGRWPSPAWVAYSPNYDASYEGPEDGWVDNGEKASGDTYDDLTAEIDEWFASQKEAGALARGEHPTPPSRVGLDPDAGTRQHGEIA